MEPWNPAFHQQAEASNAKRQVLKESPLGDETFRRTAAQHLIHRPFRRARLPPAATPHGQHPKDPMPIPPLPENVSFDPEQIKTITSAYEKALQELRLMDADPRTEALAKQIIAGAQNGEHNPDRLCAFALRALSTS